MTGEGKHPQGWKWVLPSGFRTWRDLISFGIGIAIILNEVFNSAEVEVYAVGVGIALAGLPLALSADDKTQQRQGNGSAA
jgi:hypothetical protein